MQDSPSVIDREARPRVRHHGRALVCAGLVSMLMLAGCSDDGARVSAARRATTTAPPTTVPTTTTTVVDLASLDSDAKVWCAQDDNFDDVFRAAKTLKFPPAAEVYAPGAKRPDGSTVPDDSSAFLQAVRKENAVDGRWPSVNLPSRTARALKVIQRVWHTRQSGSVVFYSDADLPRACKAAFEARDLSPETPEAPDAEEDEAAVSGVS